MSETANVDDEKDGDLNALSAHHLFTTGILSSASHDIPTSGAPPVVHQLSTLSANQPAAKDSRLNSKAGGARRKTQPPIFWKAFGFALKNIFTVSGSLYDDGRALFIGEPGQQGIPGGPSCPQEATNYQIYLKVDTMQTLNEPSFSLEGSSYFNFLESYLTNVGGSQSKTLANAQDDRMAAKRKKDEAWSAAYQRYTNDKSQPPPGNDGSLIDYLDHDSAYQDAWKQEEDAQQRLTEAQSSSLKSVSAALDVIRLADARLKPQQGNNMPVVAVSEDWILKARLGAGTPTDKLVDPNLLYYRPEYVLPGYQTIVQSWFSKARDSPLHDGPYVIPLAGVWDRSWGDLGHPLLDAASPGEKFTDAQKQFIDSLTVTLSFSQAPVAVDVNTGLWDVHDVRRRFPLPATAPAAMRRKVCKTVKVLLAWGLEIVLTVPPASASLVTAATAVQNKITLAALNLPLKDVQGDGQKLVFQAGANGVPILLGVLAEII